MDKKTEFKITWIDLKDQTPIIKVKSKGYETISIPDSYIYRAHSDRTIGGFLEPKIIEMRKIK